MDKKTLLLLLDKIFIDDIAEKIADMVIFKPKTKEEIQKAVDIWCENKEEAILKYGYISIWDTSLITDMSYLFKCKNHFEDTCKYKFNDDISNWNVSNVTNMRGMFSSCYLFNQPLNTHKVTRNDDSTYIAWDVSNVINMQSMFGGARSFIQPLNNWNVSNVENMIGMFSGCYKFNQPLEKWDISKVEWCFNMFAEAKSFNQPLNKWNLSNKVYMTNCMFSGAISFNQNLNNWKLSNVHHTRYMFKNAESFNQNINEWDMSNIDDMNYMFEGSGMEVLPEWYRGLTGKEPFF